MDKMQGKWALVTGASSGLGADFARQLASRGANLILVARRKERMEELAKEILAQHTIQIEILAMDLGSSESAQDLFAAVKAKDLSVDILVNNAGFGVYGLFLEIPWEREKAMLELDILSLVHLSKLFARDMVSRGYGRILQVASIGAYQPCPTYASYGAAKAFVLSFGEALNYELKGTGVSCSVLSPGVTATEFLAVSGQEKTAYQKMAMMDSPTVVQIGLNALFKSVPSVVPGLLNKVSVFSLRLMSRSMATAVAYLTMRSEETAK